MLRTILERGLRSVIAILAAFLLLNLLAFVIKIDLDDFISLIATFAFVGFLVDRFATRHLVRMLFSKVSPVQRSRTRAGIPPRRRKEQAVQNRPNSPNSGDDSSSN